MLKSSRLCRFLLSLCLLWSLGSIYLPQAIAAPVLQSQLDCESLLSDLLDKKNTPIFDKKNSINFKARFSRIWSKIVRGDFLVIHENSGLKALEKETIDTGRSRPSIQQLQSIWTEVLNHPVAGLCHLKSYDPTGHIGFCFGRAMAVHLEAMIRGIDELYMKKVFILGDFNNPTKEDEYWSYHVTTIVRANDDHWYAIDPRMDGPVSLQHWAEHWSLFATGPVKYLVSEPRILFPHGGTYESVRNLYFRSNAKRFKQLEASKPGFIGKYLNALAESYYQALARLPQ